MHRLHAAGAQRGLEVEVEVRRIDADEELGPFAQQPGAQLAPDAGDLGVVAQHLDIAAHRQLLLRPPALEAARQHLRAADAHRLHGRPARLQAVEQQPGQQVARGLARDQRELSLCFRHARPP